jgi:predicted GNAT family acetyltransferase
MTGGFIMDFTTEKNRIFKQDESGKILAEILFPDEGPGTAAITRTFVDGSLEGQGIADKLMKAAVAEIKAQGKQAAPVCSYAVKWFEKHPEHKDLLAHHD